MEPVKLGVIGCGVIGSSHLRTAVNSSLIDLVAVADLIEENRQRAIEQFQPKKVYNSSSDLLDDEEIEAVVLAFPTQYRTQVALEAFSKGKHVLTEKPVAINANQVREMIAARGNLIAGCCSSRNRFHKSAQVTTEFIQSFLNHFLLQFSKRYFSDHIFLNGTKGTIFYLGEHFRVRNRD